MKKMLLALGAFGFLVACNKGEAPVQDIHDVECSRRIYTHDGSLLQHAKVDLNAEKTQVVGITYINEKNEKKIMDAAFIQGVNKYITEETEGDVPHKIEKYLTKNLENTESWLEWFACHFAK